jgi:hypothetical protein
MDDRGGTLGSPLVQIARSVTDKKVRVESTLPFTVLTPEVFKE